LYFTRRDWPFAKVMVNVNTPFGDPGFTVTLKESNVPLSRVTSAVVPRWLATDGRP
jgi:hypothetical protein